MMCKECLSFMFEQNSQEQQTQASDLSLVRGAACRAAAQRGRLQGRVKLLSNTTPQPLNAETQRHFSSSLIDTH